VEQQTRELLTLALPSLREHAVIVFDPEGVVRGWSGASEHVFGYAPSEIEGQSGSILFTPEDREKGLDRLELEVALSGSTGHDDRWHLRKDGTRIWTYGSVTAIWDGTVLRGFLKIVRDRTDLKMDLEAKANRLTELEAAHERTQRFLRTLGHEMRNPLGPLKNSAFILARISEDDRVKKIAESIENQVRILERLAEDLMDVARLEHGKVELRIEDLDVNELLKQEVAAHMDQARAKGVRMETVLSGPPLTARLDEDRVRQAVANLLTNAIKYTPSGGRIWVKGALEGEDVAIRVQDTGIGIAGETVPLIFDLFTQEKRAQEFAAGGLGIGLSIVREIALLHGGVAQAKSGGAGKGAEFTIRLPAHTAKVPKPPSHSS